MSIRRIQKLLPLLLVVLTLAACGGSAARGSQQRGARGAILEIRNASWAEMTIYAVDAGARTRLGRVSGNSSATFPIPDGLVGFGRRLSFLADPAGPGAAAVSFEQDVRPGQRVTLTIPATVR